jgi:hypothetical protein
MPYPTSWRSILILSSYLGLGLPSGRSPSFRSPHQNPVCISLFSHTCYIPRPSTPRNIPEGRRFPLHGGGSLKSGKMSLLVPILSYNNAVHILPSYLRSDLILSSQLGLLFQVVFLLGFPSKTFYPFLFSPRRIRPAHLKLFQTNYIEDQDKITNLSEPANLTPFLKQSTMLYSAWIS